VRLDRARLAITGTYVLGTLAWSFRRRGSACEREPVSRAEVAVRGAILALAAYLRFSHVDHAERRSSQRGRDRHQPRSI